ncbi:hypothetical protein Tco_0346537 [Tanacetum coccineum]
MYTLSSCHHRMRYFQLRSSHYLLLSHLPLIHQAMFLSQILRSDPEEDPEEDDDEDHKEDPADYPTDRDGDDDEEEEEPFGDKADNKEEDEDDEKEEEEHPTPVDTILPPVHRVTTRISI